MRKGSASEKRLGPSAARTLRDGHASADGIEALTRGSGNRHQQSDALDVVGHREQVEGAQSLEHVAVLREDRDVPGQGGRVARDVGDRARCPGCDRSRRRYGGRPRAEGRGRPGRPAPPGAPRGPRRRHRGGPWRRARSPRRARTRAGRPRPASRRTDRRPRRPGTARTTRRRRTGRAPTPPAVRARKASTVSTSTSGAPGCTCQKPSSPTSNPMPCTAWSAGGPAIRQSSTSTTSCDRCLRIPRRRRAGRRSAAGSASAVRPAHEGVCRAPAPR